MATHARATTAGGGPALAAVEMANLKIQLLEERARLERIRKYGPASEKLSNAQLELLEEEPGVSNLEVAAESARELLPAAAQPGCHAGGGLRRAVAPFVRLHRFP